MHEHLKTLISLNVHMHDTLTNAGPCHSIRINRICWSLLIHALIDSCATLSLLWTQTQVTGEDNVHSRDARAC